MACEPTWSISSGSRPLKNGCALRNVRLSTVCGGIAYSSYILSRMVTHCSLTLRSVRIYFTRIKPPFRDGVQTFCASLLDHLVGRGQQRFRDGEAEGLRRFKIDDQINFRDLLHWEIGGLLAFENAPGIDASLTVLIADAAAIAHQATGQDVFTVWEDRGQRMAVRQRRELFHAPVVEGTQ